MSSQTPQRGGVDLQDEFMTYRCYATAKKPVFIGMARKIEFLDRNLKVFLAAIPDGKQLVAPM